MSIECTSKTVWMTKVVCSRCPKSASYELNQRDTLIELKKRGWSCQFLGLDLCPDCLKKDRETQEARSKALAQNGAADFPGYTPRVLWFEEVAAFPVIDYRNLATDEGSGP